MILFGTSKYIFINIPASLCSLSINNYYDVRQFYDVSVSQSRPCAEIDVNKLVSSVQDLCGFVEISADVSVTVHDSVIERCRAASLCFRQSKNCRETAAADGKCSLRGLAFDSTFSNVVISFDITKTISYFLSAASLKSSITFKCVAASQQKRKGPNSIHLH